MRIKKLTIGETVYSDNVSISDALHKNNITWLDDAEIDNAILEIKDGKLYWYAGIWYFGDWIYGIFMDGTFMYGNWYNGIFYNGLFKNGIFHDGIFMNGIIEDGEFLKGEIKKDVIRKGGKFSEELILKESIIKFINFKK